MFQWESLSETLPDLPKEKVWGKLLQRITHFVCYRRVILIETTRRSSASFYRELRGFLQVRPCLISQKRRSGVSFYRRIPNFYISTSESGHNTSRLGLAKSPKGRRSQVHPYRKWFVCGE